MIRSPLRDELERAGAVFHAPGDDGMAERARTFGDPGGEYRAATEGAAVVDRSERRRILLEGRAPGQMLQGILTQRVPGPERPVEPGVRAGKAAYSAVLTAKGRMVTDLRVLRTDGVEEGAGDAGPAPGSGTPAAGSGLTRGPAAAPGGGSESGRFLLDVPAEGAAGLDEHFGRFLPPRFATREDISGETAMITLLGPEAAGLISLHAVGLRVDREVLEGLREGELRAVDTGAGAFLRVVRTGDVATPAFDLLGDLPTVRALWERLVHEGARPAGHAVWETLRVEAGRPAFGADMDDGTIPVEAGIDGRAIDHGKGCYTGQEVIIRIRDRGRVNRCLGRLLLGDAPAPARGTELFAPDVRGEKTAGEVRSVVQSPRQGGGLALVWLRREVELPGEVRLGAPDGPAVRAESLPG